MDNIDKLRGCFSSSLGVGIEVIKPELEYNTIAEWDSVAHMSLVTQIETDFDVMLDTDEIISMSSFEEAQNILKSHGIEF